MNKIKYSFNEIKKYMLDNFDLNYLLEDYSLDEYDIDIYEDEEIIIEKYVDWKKVEKLYDTLDEKWFKEVYKNNIRNHDNSSLDYFDATINFDNQDINLEWMRDDIKSEQEIKNYLKSKSFMTEIIFQLLKDHPEFWNQEFKNKINNSEKNSENTLNRAKQNIVDSLKDLNNGFDEVNFILYDDKLNVYKENNKYCVYYDEKSTVVEFENQSKLVDYIEKELFNNYKKELSAIRSGTWDDASYFYDEECICCGYKSIDYAKEHKYSYDDFEELDDYDGFRWQETKDGCVCEVCYKKTEVANRKKQFPNIKFLDSEGDFNIQLDMNPENINFVDEWIGEGNWTATEDNLKLIVNLDFEEGVQCDFLEQLSDYINHEKLDELKSQKNK